ncbi:xanthine dehydrogenase family protein molybdopterin-binding subunit [Streptomyces albireticuli]|uniref:xanthine dehydrogenase family protein molybdopterin-binding subunit n=1 Tax=Streptomyces albireticuli TaxID=1940 RepID=UPI001E3B0B90|nr:molybdopterin cofactor-binding domain-containing protein [Streptomyces albireticuli]MCD9142411.1 molybdopterin-dependent oxidoreductase [Streptomyces albireticuli]MCD9166056.1 molybdopterin-dependent oxidoreductase [Streptomyces albireticuli]MCD9192539.1 molybdopterin-dependent oxidoreductase [Streptomyces albireticuli]
MAEQQNLEARTEQQAPPPPGTRQDQADPAPPPHRSRRRFLTYLLAAPTLAVAAGLGPEGAAPAAAAGADGVVPTLPGPADLLDLGDVLILAGAPTAHLLVLTVGEDGTVTFRLPREEVGQGLTTAVAMLVAEELDVPLARVRVQLDDARPELLFNQFTASSNSIRSLYDPVRHTAAAARARLVAAAADRWGLKPGKLTTRDGAVVAPDGRTAPYGTLTAAAASRHLVTLTARPKPESAHTLVGTPTPRVDARAMVTGRQSYTLDLDVPGAKPCMVRRPPTVYGTVRAVNNEAAVRAMPGVLATVVIPTGVAVVAETFGQALDAKNALDVTWGPGTIDGYSDDGIRARLRSAVSFPPLPPPLTRHLDAEFDFAPVSHAPLETNAAVADVRADRATVWSGLKAPIVAQQTIAKELGLPVGKVTVHVVQAGGSFGRRLFFDAALEAAQVSKGCGRPVRLMWSRVDDMRHGRMRPATHHKIRVSYASGRVVALDHRVAAVETDVRHGLGEILTATGTKLPGGLGNAAFAQGLFHLTVKSPYHFGVTGQHLTEVPLRMPTASWRSVYSANTRGAEEMLIDELAARMGKDPVEFRRDFLKNSGQRAVLDKVAGEGAWGRPMPAGHAQGIGFHEEYKSRTACLVEIDATDPRHPRVTKAVIAADVGRAVNPRGLEAQLLGGLTDAISTTLTAGLHIDKGLPLEGSYSQFHYARQKDTPPDVRIFVMPATGEPGGAGELGVPAAVGAVGNAYARATGTRPRRFPVNFDVDFTPFPR